LHPIVARTQRHDYLMLDLFVSSPIRVLFSGGLTPWPTNGIGVKPNQSCHFHSKMVVLNNFWTHKYRVEGAFEAEGRRIPSRVTSLGSFRNWVCASSTPTLLHMNNRRGFAISKENEVLIEGNERPDGACQEACESSDDDEYCGVDVVTSELIRGKDCKTLERMEMMVVKKPECRIREATDNELQNEVYSTQSCIQPTFWDRLGGESGANLPAHMVRPYYRATPIRAELERGQSDCKTAQILFLDEGGELRSILGAALMRHMLSRLRTRLDVEVDWASLGPPTGTGWADPRVKALASAMGICSSYLSEKDCRAQVRQFEDIKDAVKYDLILVMDRFDYQEVMREVAVLDTINPGGHYADRVKLIGPFAWAAKSRGMNRHIYNKKDGYVTALERFTDVPDPSYEWQIESWKETAALQQTAKILARGCRGLASFLIDVECGRKRVCRSGIPTFLHFRDALRQALCCPLINCDFVQVNPTNPALLHRNLTKNQTPESNTSHEVAVAWVGGRRKIVKVRTKSRGYWKDASHVDEELLKFMNHMGLERLPTQKELRANGESSMASAIDMHGGMAVFATRLGIPLALRKPNGYWKNFEALKRELQPYIDGDMAAIQAAPSYRESIMPLILQRLRSEGRNDVAGAIQMHGGSKAVALKLGLLWEADVSGERTVEIKGIVERLRLWMRQVGLVNRFPTRQELREHGRTDLAADVKTYGGGKCFAQLLGVDWLETRGPKRRATRKMKTEHLHGTAMEEEGLREELDLLDCYEEFVFL
jgi:protein-tyrosine-phosphatase